MWALELVEALCTFTAMKHLPEAGGFAPCYPAFPLLGVLSAAP